MYTSGTHVCVCGAVFGARVWCSCVVLVCGTHVCVCGAHVYVWCSCMVLVGGARVWCLCVVHT